MRTPGEKRAKSSSIAILNEKLPGGAMKFTIPSDFAAGRQVQKAIIDEVEKHRYGHQSCFAIKLALEEALINAIKHGNKTDPTKKVYVTADITDDRAQIEIEDEGPGFKRSDVPDPTCDANLHKCSGRGILLIEAYMTSVEWSCNGRRIKMTKINEPDPT